MKPRLRAQVERHDLEQMFKSHQGYHFYFIHQSRAEIHLISLYQCRQSVRQVPHHTLKSDQRSRIRRERPQKARRKAPPIPPPACLTIHRPHSVPPSRELSFAISQRPSERVCHHPLLHDIRGVGSQPEHLRGETPSPEIDRWSAQGGVGLEEAGEKVVAAPPEEEE